MTLARLTSKNQLTLPKAAVEARAGQLVLTPVRMQRGDAARAKLAQLDLADNDLAAAVRWARKAAPALAACVAEPKSEYHPKPAGKRKSPKPHTA